MDQWQKLVDTNDLVSYERKAKDMKIRIEARLVHDDQWQIFVTYNNGKEVNYTEEYRCKNKEELHKLIAKLQDMKVKTKKEIEHLSVSQNKQLGIDLTREFRDYNVEKWRFTIEKSPTYNFLLIRDSEFIDIDIIMHEKYKFHEANIIHELYKILGLSDSGLPIRRNIFYYADRSTTLNNAGQNQLFIGNIEFDFSGGYE